MCTKFKALTLSEPLLLLYNTQNLGCDFLMTLHEWFQKFRRVILPLSDTSSVILLGLLKPDYVLLTQRPIDISQKI